MYTRPLVPLVRPMGAEPMYPVTYAVAPRSFNSVVPVQYMNRQDPQYVEKIYSKERKFNARHIIEEEDDLIHFLSFELQII